LAAGLDLAIINPLSAAMMKAYRSFLLLNNQDEGCLEYIDFASRLQEDKGVVLAKGAAAAAEADGLKAAIISGREEKAGALAAELLQAVEPLQLINLEIVPALDAVGQMFEKGEVFLPQLLRSAAAATAAFDEVKKNLPASAAGKPEIIIATVKGDIHDIGKNIVKVLLESHGYPVLDLGRDVAPETVLKTAVESGAPLVGLSALMTTTVPAMEETIALLKKNAPHIKIMVGGAVLTADFAKKIGADFYAADGMGAVHIVKEFFGE